MRIVSLKGTNIELTDAIKTYVEDKVEMLKKLTSSFGDAVEMRAEVGKSTNHHAKGPFMRAEMQVHLPGKVVRAVEEAEDLYAAIDKAKDQVRRQIKDYKEKARDAMQRAERPGK